MGRSETMEDAAGALMKAAPWVYKPLTGEHRGLMQVAKSPTQWYLVKKVEQYMLKLDQEKARTEVLARKVAELEAAVAASQEESAAL
eukprot:3936472-Rhodomonas_salina.2